MKTVKRIENRGWSVKTLANGEVKATKNGVVVKGESLSEVRFLIRFEKFYFGMDFVSVDGLKGFWANL